MQVTGDVLQPLPGPMLARARFTVCPRAAACGTSVRRAQRIYQHFDRLQRPTAAAEAAEATIRAATKEAAAVLASIQRARGGGG